MNRLPAHVRRTFLEGAGVLALSGDSSDYDIWDALHVTSRLCLGLELHDQALLYAETVHHLEQVGIDLGATLESVFFDRITQELSIHGEDVENEGGQVRAEDRSLVVRDPTAGGVPTDRRAAAGEPGGPSGIVVAIDDPGGAGQAPAPAERVEGVG